MSDENRRMTVRPPHPGEVLKLDVLPAMPDLTQGQLAEVLGVSRQTVSAILGGKSPVSADIAVKLGTLFGNEPQFWLNMQAAVDVWDAQHRLAEKLPEIAFLRTMLRDVGY
jgi:antitoxin HigA-1